MLLKQLIDENSLDLQFETSIGVFELSKERNVYNAIRKKYLGLADDVSNQFSERLNKYGDHQEVINSLQNDMEEYLKKGIEVVKDDLLSCGVFDIDNESIHENAKELRLLDAVYGASENFFSQIMKVQHDLNQEVAAREARKDNRARWQGGTISSGNEGFVESYIDDASAQLEIGARNVIEGVGHSLINMVGNSISQSAATNKMKAIWDDKKTRDALVVGMRESVFKLHQILIYLLKKEDEWKVRDINSVEKARRFAENSTNPVLGKEQGEQLLRDAWALDAYNEKIYGYLIEINPDYSESITKMAEHFGLDLTDLKDKMAINFLKKNLGRSEEDAWEAKKLLGAYCEKICLPYSERLKSASMIDEIIKKFDLEYRMVDDDFECSTREEADKAREEEKKIVQFINGIQPPTEESLLDYEKGLLNKLEEFNQTFTSELKRKYLVVLDRYMKEFNEKYCSVGMFGKMVDRKTASSIKATQYAKKLDVSTEEAYMQALEYLKRFLPFVGLREDEAEEAFLIVENNRNKFLDNNSQSILGKVSKFSSKMMSRIKKNDTKKEEMEESFCPNCGAKIKKGWMFCTKCGYRMNS